MPTDNWICLATSSKAKPDFNLFHQFARDSIRNGILEFKGHGKYGENLHDWFDETIQMMASMDNHPEIEIMTTWHANESIADVVWQCFFATCLPESTEHGRFTIVCTDLDHQNRKEEIESYDEIPKKNIKSWYKVITAEEMIKNNYIDDLDALAEHIRPMIRHLS